MTTQAGMSGFAPKVLIQPIKTEQSKLKAVRDLKDADQKLAEPLNATVDCSGLTPIVRKSMPGI